MNDVIAVLRIIALEPDAQLARDELQRMVIAWVERQRRRTEMAFATE